MDGNPGNGRHGSGRHGMALVPNLLGCWVPLLASDTQHPARMCSVCSDSSVSVGKKPVLILVMKA